MNVVVGADEVGRDFGLGDTIWNTEVHFADSDGTIVVDGGDITDVAVVATASGLEDGADFWGVVDDIAHIGESVGPGTSVTNCTARERSERARIRGAHIPSIPSTLASDTRVARGVDPETSSDDAQIIAGAIGTSVSIGVGIGDNRGDVFRALVGRERAVGEDDSQTLAEGCDGLEVVTGDDFVGRGTVFLGDGGNVVTGFDGIDDARGARDGEDLANGKTGGF